MINLKNAADTACDIWEETTSNQTSRTGNSAARIASSLANGVAPEVIALQMTMNSKKNNPDDPVVFSAPEITAIEKLHKANRSQSAYTKKQAGSLISRQHSDDGNNLTPSVV